MSLKVFFIFFFLTYWQDSSGDADVENILVDTGQEGEGGTGSEVGERVRREGTYIYLWVIHVDTCQKPTQYCKAIIFQLKITIFLKNA